MGDYVTACGGSLASMTTIGIPVPEATALMEKWSAQGLVSIPSGGAAATAARIAKANWEWSEAAVVAVVDPEVAPISVVTEGTLEGTLPPVAPRHGEFTGSIEPSFHSQAEHAFVEVARPRQVAAQESRVMDAQYHQIAIIGRRSTPSSIRRSTRPRSPRSAAHA